MENNEKELEFLRQVFKKFDTHNTGYLDSDEFHNLIVGVAKQVTTLNHTDISTTEAAFAYYDRNRDGKLSFQEIYKWWISEKRFRFFMGDCAGLIKKARQIYKSYAKTSTKGMTFAEFERLLDDLKIQHEETAFDNIDTDDDGLVSFTEFFDWLKWC